ncbi:MAG: type I DNA topoisomerase [Oscillospiraceae bacterium]|jgi:DNA topoisomerase-1|nr:type I DNA topoisomerase [Oscillospiraceae bacterium]
MKNLVIVESPAKAKTIEKYLKHNYNVVASVGHIRDLPKSRFGVDIENGFTPKYSIIKARKDLIKNLKEHAKKCPKVFLATDPDREGEAISWHLAQILKIDLNEINRVVFNEITPKGIQNGIKNPRKINLNLVDAQQARRILDRIVGYKISPLLWRKIRRGLSAGRVQSVAVKIIVDRECKIREFVSQEYWTIEALLLSAEKKQITAKLEAIAGKKTEINLEKEANEILTNLKEATFIVGNIKIGTSKRSSPLPFITSTLQQEAYNRLSYSAKKTMKIAQELYEGINTKKFGTQGLITYMRTDSLRISDDAKTATRAYIIEKYGEKYLGQEKKIKKKANIQDAHEAIRPTDINIIPDLIKDNLTPEQYKLYKLIWERFIASCMADTILDTASVEINAANYKFVASGYLVKFNGFNTISSFIKNDSNATALFALIEGEILTTKALEKLQHFTQPPARFTEASLIKALEEQGIGRPSTYAPIISTILAREYVIKEGKSLKPTGLGEGINNVLIEYFNKFVDEKFTSNMESELDLIETGELNMLAVLKNFYADFVVALEFAETNMDRNKILIPEEQTEEICDVCGANMVVKFGKFGKFLSCAKYPECNNKKKYLKPTGGICNKCRGKIILKRSKTGKIYYGCEHNPTCDFMTWNQPITDQCPKCNATLFRTKGKNSKIICLVEGCDFCKA